MGCFFVKLLGFLGLFFTAFLTKGLGFGLSTLFVIFGFGLGFGIG